MKKLLLLLTLFIATSANVFATESMLNIAITSNYVFRGDTQTNDKAAVQMTYQRSEKKDAGFYVGGFASNVYMGAEVDVFGGFKLGIGKQKKFIIDLGAVEYLYSNDNFAPISHELYAGVQYDLSYLKYYFGEQQARYLDLGTGFSFGNLDILFHFGEVFATARNGSDISVTIQRHFNSTRLELTATYEDKSASKESGFLVYLSVDI